METENGENGNLYFSETDWELCIICQASTSENLRCPKDRKNSDFLLVYNTFLKNVNQFKQLKSDHIPAGFVHEKSANHLAEKSASWHHSCHQKFTQSRLDRLIKKRKKEEDSDEVKRKSKRSEDTLAAAKCLFCKVATKEKLHSYCTVNADQNIRKMAAELNDTELIGCLSGGDCMSLEMKYHLTCLTRYRNKYRSAVRGKNSSSNLVFEKAKARAFVELIAHIEEKIEDNIYLFKLLRSANNLRK